MKKIAILGNRASFHELAAQTYYKQPLDFICCPSPEAVIQQIQNNPNCDGGILAVENSLAGLVPKHYESLQTAGIHISGELILKIQHHLLALPNTYLHNIEEIRTHPMAIKQCDNFLQHIHPSTRLCTWSDTASAAKTIATEQLENVAAIGSALAAELYKLDIIAENIQNNQHNYTRFLVLTNKTITQPVQQNKATITFELAHHVGSLSRVLQLLEQAEINLTKLHSFPIKAQTNRYRFLVDLEFKQLKHFKRVQQALEKITNHLTILGTYQKDHQSNLLATINN